MEILKWNDSLMSVDIELIDDQHKALLRIVNDLAITIKENSQKKDITDIVDRLIDYAHYHFSTEENYFAEFNFDEITSHKEDHQEFAKNFLQIRKSLDDTELYRGVSTVLIATEIFEYIADWFIVHVTGSDRKYIELFKQKGIK